MIHDLLRFPMGSAPNVFRLCEGGADHYKYRPCSQDTAMIPIVIVFTTAIPVSHRGGWCVCVCVCVCVMPELSSSREIGEQSLHLYKRRALSVDQSTRVHTHTRTCTDVSVPADMKNGC